MKRSPLFVIFFVVFIDLVGFGIVIPILPYYSREFGANAWDLGWLMAIYSIMQFGFSPFWGSLSDRFGRRSILLTTILGTALALTATASAKSLLTLFVARGLAGIFAANISTAGAYIADVTPPEDRAKGMGIIGASFGLGFLFGPFIGGSLAPYGYPVPIFTAAALGVLNFFFALAVLKEPKIASEIRKEHRRKFSWNLMKDSLSDPRTALPITLFFLATLGMTQLEVTFGFYVLTKFGLGARDAGFLLGGMGIVAVLVQGGLIGRLAKKYGEFRLATAGLFIAAIALVLAPLPSSAHWFATTLALLAVGTGIVNPSLSSTVSKAAHEHKRGEVMGVYQSAGSFARIIGPLIAGFVYDHIGIASPIFISALLMAIAGITAIARKRYFVGA